MMEFSSQVYKPQTWPCLSSLSYNYDEITDIIHNYVLSLINGNKRNKTRLFKERITDTKSNIKQDTTKYIDIQEITESIFNPLNEAKQRLEKIAALEDNWNEHGAKGFSSKHIERVLHIIDDLPVAPYVFPTAIGAIQIEYQKKDGSYLEFEIYEDMANQYMIDADKNEIERTIVNYANVKKNVIQAVVDFYE